MLCSIINYPHCICKAEHIILSRFVCFSCTLVLLETVCFTKIYIKMLYCKTSKTLNNLYKVEWYVLRWMICTMLNDLYNTLNGLYFVEWFELRWVICTLLNDCNTLKDWHHNGRLALGSMICTAVHSNIGVVFSSLFLKIQKKYPDFVSLLD